jgi:hypothetical protein
MKAPSKKHFNVWQCNGASQRPTSLVVLAWQVDLLKQCVAMYSTNIFADGTGHH